MALNAAELSYHGRAMSLEPGQMLLHYLVADKIGEGGMGVVWAARDTTLDRKVAIKILPAPLAADTERLARLEREAKLLASLNHPNIAGVYGLHTVPSTEPGQADLRFLVMEYVPGEDLQQHLARGPLAIDDATDVAAQVARALEAAHAQGIVHRDLKPANIVRADDGTIKVLDFGLAKALTADPASGETDPALSPTMTSAGTQAGMIIGTATYMSPEQARGKPVDRRADIWSFGCVFFEMLTGRKPFDGDDVTEILAHIITREPDLELLPADLPTPLPDIIRRCLRKDVRMRLPDIGAARIAIVESEDAPTSSVAPTEGGTRSPILRVAALGLVALAVGLALGWILRGGAPPRDETAATHFDLSLEPPLGHASMAISADGGTVIYSGVAEGKRQLYRRDLSGFTSQPIPETEEGRWPFFSPDGQKIGFFAAGRLKIASLRGGLAEPICAVPGAIQGVIWYPDDRIVYSSRMLTVPHSVSASGGQPLPLEIQGMEAGTRVTFPAALPGYGAFLATLETPSPDESRVVVVDSSDGTMKSVVRGHAARYVEPGALVFLQRDRVMIAPFDVSTLELTGAERPVDLDLPAIGRSATTEEQFEVLVSANGTLLYPSGSFAESAELSWLSRDGTVEPTGIRGIYARLDATGRRALLHHESGYEEIWLVELVGGEATRLSFTGLTTYPLWSHDGKDAIYGYREGAGYSIYSLTLDGGDEPHLLLAESEAMPSIVPTSMHPDGRLMVYAVHPETSRDIWILDRDGTREPVLHTGANERAAILSPDGSLFAYVSDEDGTEKLILREFPDSGRRWFVSDQGTSPVWSRDGNELFFRVGDAIRVAAIRREGGLRIGEAVEVFRSDRLFRDEWGNTTFDVAPDGRLLVSLLDPQNLRPRVVLDWSPGVGEGP